MKDHYISIQMSFYIVFVSENNFLMLRVTETTGNA